MPRWVLPAALFVSLALNVFVVGAFVGAHMAGGRPAPAVAPKSPRPGNPMAVAVRSLTPAQQTAWRAQMQASVPRMREARERVRQVMQSFGEEPFDAAARLAALEAARAVEQEARAEMDRRLVTFAATLPPADRARFGEALARPPVGRGRPGRRQALPDR